MTPQQATLNLKYILANQKTVSTSKIIESIHVISNHNKMLESDNRELRKRINRQRKTLRRHEGNE